MITIPKDKKLHFLCSFGIAFVFALFFFLIGMSAIELSIASFSVAFAAGIGKEYADKVNPHNYWDWYDVLADFLGSITGLILPLVLKIIIG